MASDLTAAECPLLLSSSAGAEGLSLVLIHAKVVEKASTIFFFFLLCCSVDIHCSTPSFFIFVRDNGCNNYKHKCELWSSKMFVIKCLFFFFFIKLKVCLVGEMCNNIRGQWEDRVRQEGVKVIAWSVRA